MTFHDTQVGETWKTIRQEILDPSKKFPCRRYDQGVPVCVQQAEGFSILLHRSKSRSCNSVPLNMAHLSSVSIQRHPFADCSTHAQRRSQLVARGSSKADDTACGDRRRILLAGQHSENAKSTYETLDFTQFEHLLLLTQRGLKKSSGCQDLQR